MQLLLSTTLHLLLLINLPHTFGEDVTLSLSVEGGESAGEGEAVSVSVGDPCVGHDCPEGEVCQVMINHRLLQMPVAHCVQTASSIYEGLCHLYSLGSNVMNCRSESQWRRVGENQCHLRGEGGAVLTDVQVEHACHRHHSESSPKFLSADFMCCPGDEPSSPPSSQADISPSTSSKTQMDSTDRVPTQASTMRPQPTLPPSKGPQKPGSVTSGYESEASMPYSQHPQPVQGNHNMQLLLAITLALILVISIIILVAIVLRYKYRYNIVLKKTSQPRETAIINPNSIWRKEMEEEEKEEEVIWEDHDTSPILSPSVTS